MKATRRRGIHDGCAPASDLAALEADLTNLEAAVFGRLAKVEESNEQLQQQMTAVFACVPAIRGILAAWLEVLADLER